MAVNTDLPLAGLVVLDMSQFLSGPYATLGCRISAPG
ncbi:hypothetical protein SAMN05877838_3404 [Hoeflea halophila]|uniref:Uncharacterized protein n=1 Tax=Hoeflea halophila TaxID=714899 RepID=A0A286IEM5_9HYPH|nr:hypothetical protein SAMN05877838_3404 [Hoeflea halophila]